MSPARALKLVNSWETIRFELLNTRVSEMGLRTEGSPIEPFIRRLNHELAEKGVRFRPRHYLTDSWGCPDEVPVIGVPFYLADERLSRIEEEQTGEIEDASSIMMLLRHEAGHAINYAYRLFREPDWVDMFGPFSRPYRDTFDPNPFSREFVRHIVHHRHGRTYAQKHPDEDWAETFAVWLTPRSGWRRRYRNWPALQKLRYVDTVMDRFQSVTPRIRRRKLCTPVDEMNLTLAEHYGQRAERYRAAAQGYVDDKLTEVFPPTKGDSLISVVDFLRRHKTALVEQVTRWAGLPDKEVQTLLGKLSDRAAALDLYLPRRRTTSKLVEIAALATALAMNFAYTGRLTG